MKNEFQGKTILVTGGCGSIGSEIVAQLLKYDPEAIRVFDHNEEGHFKLSQKIKSKKIRHLIGDIRDQTRVSRACDGVDIIFHAAALKHVPFCEYNPFEAVTSNVLGTKNLVDAAMHHKVEKFIAISTDKAVNPINTMGATKLLAEKIVTNAPIGKFQVKFGCVRFGNVLNSSGSVIPIFKKQIREGNTITITDENMTRFFMHLPEAVNLVLKAAELVQGGETFILKMNALKITDLAQALIEELAPKYGKDPKDFKYNFIGIRPGEKLYESLLTAEEAEYTEELPDMLVLKNSLLAKYGKETEITKADHKEYNSDNTPLLTTEQIKKVLREQKSIIPQPDLLVMCGTKLRHKYFAIRLMKEFPNSVVLTESHKADTSKTYVEKEEPTEEIRKHFAEFEETQSKFFEEYVKENEEFFNSRLVREVDNHTINEPENVEFIKNLNPKVIAIHSTSLIKEDLIKAFPQKLINLHAGLSPYYRGSGTNLWPFFNKELEYVGMTIHYIDIGIDSGDILLQGRPQFEASDNTHTIGCKNVILGSDLMIKTLRRYLAEGPIPGKKQDKSKGNLYLKKKFSEATTLEIRKLIKEDMVKDYANNPKEVDLVEW